MTRPNPPINDVELNPRQSGHHFELIVDHPLINMRTHSFFYKKESLLRAFNMCHPPGKARVKVLNGAREQEHGR